VTLVARLGLAEVGSAYQSSQSGEVLYSVTAPERSVSLAAGGGLLHEPGGTNVLLARIAGGRNAASWRFDGNVLLHKPLATARDGVDLITSVGWARKLSHGVSLGAEAIGEDLEGFWEPNEAEGGARLLAGPSLHVGPAGRRWQMIATGGPLFHPSDTGRSNDALRDLPPETRRTSYAFKASMSVSLSSSH
jgi:hypothetical protein